MTQANDVAINVAAAHHGASLGSGENGGPARRRQLTAAKVFLTSQVPCGVALTGTCYSCALAHWRLLIDPCASMRAPVSQRIWGGRRAIRAHRCFWRLRVRSRDGRAPVQRAQRPLAGATASSAPDARGATRGVDYAGGAEKRRLARRDVRRLRGGAQRR